MARVGSINSLKADELILILEKVENSNDKRSVCEVSKDFLRSMCFLLKRLNCALPSLLNVVLPFSRNLLAFSSSVPLRNSDLKLLAKSCPELKVLLLGRERYIGPPHMDMDFDDEGLSELASCNRLVRVVLTGRINVRDLGVISVVTSARNLQRLSLKGCINVGDESLRAIGNLTELIFLNVSCCTSITDDGLRYLANGQVKSSLRCLNLSNCGQNITDDGLTELSNITGMRELDLSMLVNLGDESLGAIGNLTGLQFLNVSGCSLITDDGLMNLTDGKVQNTLKSLDLSKCGENITDEGITELAKITGIQNLDLSMLVKVTTDSLFDISPYCVEIQYLSLNGCVGVMGGEEEVFPYFTKLVKLELVNCPQISWEDVKNVVRSLESLVDIVLDRGLMYPMPPAGSEECIRFGVEREPVRVTWK